MPEFIAQHVPSTGLDAFTRAYLECAEWLLPEADPDAEYDPPECEGFSQQAIDAASADCADFQTSFASDLQAYYDSGRSAAQAGHDFWLTRNRHGAGFWDRGLPKALGDKLTAMAHAYGECDVYVGDDGLIYFQ